jgi:folate-dependent phosphoribosylglycinamide formyltransferase PurN
MFLCEQLRSRVATTVVNQSLKSNQDLLDVIKDLSPDRVVLFRAGLILNREIISSGPQILNIHAASVPQYGGIGSIYRALRKGAFEQSASLHVVTEEIDRGEVLDEERYVLIPGLGYCANERIAYEAATNLLIRTLK